MIRALVVGRERPGRPIPEVVADVAERLKAAGWDIDTAVVKRKRDVRRVTRRALKDERDLVVVVGGDGVVLQVATVLAETKVALGVIPTGTGNLLAANLKIPTDRDEAVETVLTGRPTTDRRGPIDDRRQEASVHRRVRNRLRRQGHGCHGARGKDALGQARLPRERAPADRQSP